MNEFISKIRYWDNMIARWMMRHFYFMFFQFALMIIFLFWFVNVFNVIDATMQVTPQSPVLERLLAAQSKNIAILVFIIILNSFWLLYIFNCVQRALNQLKDINFNLSKMRMRNKTIS